MPPEPTTLLVVGDVHGDAAWMKVVCAKARALGCDAILQLGDFGFWPHEAWGRAYVDRVVELLARHELDCLFIDGNHDNLDVLLADGLPAAGPFRWVAPRLYYMPRGARWSWRGVSFLAMGGAYSFDKEWRLANEPAPRTWWWPQEQISDDDIRRAIEGSRPVDVLVAHDCPAGFKLGEYEPREETKRNRAALGRIVDHVRPRLLLHAHWHRRTSGWYENEELGFRTWVEGLDMEKTNEDNWLRLGLDELRRRLDRAVSSPASG